MAPMKWGAITFSGVSVHPALPALVVRDGQEDLPPPSAVSAHSIIPFISTNYSFLLSRSRGSCEAFRQVKIVYSEEFAFFCKSES